MNNQPHFIVVGAGISGLAAGVMLRKAGYEVDIYERDRSTGGLACGWDRKGYHVEGAIHWMIGSFPGSLVYPIWKEIGALQENNPVTAEDPVLTLVRERPLKGEDATAGEGDAPLEWYRDLERTEATLLRHAPEDAAAIRRLVKDVRLYKGLSQKKRGLTLRAICRMWPLINMSGEEYAAQFKNKDLRALVGSVITPYHNAFSMMYVLGAFACGEGGYPEGGATRLVQNVTDTFTRLGGRLHLQQEVERVLVEDGRACGIVVGGARHEADGVLIASDTRRAIDSLFEHPFQSKWAEQLRRRTAPNEVMFVALGVRANLDKYAHTMRFRLDEPLRVAGQAYDVLSVYNYSGYAGYAPDGCTTLTILLFGPTYDYWKQAREDGSYREKKQAVAAAVIERLEERIPELKGQVEMTDVATPVTYERYCSTFEGSLMNIWKKGEWPLLVPNRCKEIKGLYFSGHRTLVSGGLPIAVLSAQNAVKKILKDYGVF